MHTMAHTKKAKTVPKGIRFSAEVLGEVRRIARRGPISPLVNELLREALAAREAKRVAA